MKTAKVILNVVSFSNVIQKLHSLPGPTLALRITPICHPECCVIPICHPERCVIPHMSSERSVILYVILSVVAESKDPCVNIIHKILHLVAPFRITVSAD